MKDDTKETREPEPASEQTPEPEPDSNWRENPEVWLSQQTHSTSSLTSGLEDAQW